MICYETDIKESRNIANLHQQIKACDGILEVCFYCLIYSLLILEFFNILSQKFGTIVLCNYVYLYLTEFQSQNPFHFNCQFVKVITFSLNVIECN